MRKIQLVILLVAILGVHFSCDLFKNEQIPECIKQSSRVPSDHIYCYQPSYFGSPAWHPDGEWIAAEHSDSIDTDLDGLNDTLFSGIWLINAQSGQTKALLPFGGYPAWNPQGTHLAVETGGRIYTVQITSLSPARYDSSSITLLTTFDASAFFPTWSDDGQWIAFDTSFQDAKGAKVIWIIRKDGTGLRDISIHQVGEWRYANWIDSQIAHSRAVSGGSEIFVMRKDGSEPKQLTRNGGNYYPKFSPDGKKIGYVHYQGIKSSIHTIDADGSNSKVLAQSWAKGLSWSPDGKKIVYVFANQ